MEQQNDKFVNVSMLMNETNLYTIKTGIVLAV